MTFLDLYGEALDLQLASTDRTQLFTIVRRKKAVNDAVEAFIRETGATKRYGAISIVDGTGEYDLEAEIPDYIRLAEPPSIRIVTPTSTPGIDSIRYIQGRDQFPQATPDRLDWENPGWQGQDPGIPSCWYLKTDGGAKYLGCWLKPDVGLSETWTWRVPYVARPADMTGEAEIPFTFSSNVMATLEDYHQGLVHYAAALLEPARKNYDGVKYQMGLFASYVNRYKGLTADEQPGQVQLVRNYFRSRNVADDPRR